MDDLKGKTIVITGGGRGIGEAIVARFANAGANVAIIAQEELKQTSNVFSIKADVANDEEVETAISKIIERFKTIDILINNVSAFCFENTLDITPAQFDLLISLGVRATFLLSKLCVPHLKLSKNPHIVNISPPLHMNSKWFKNHLAFTMSKYGMSMCTLGMAQEFKSANIAVNSLWPLTTIATTTIKDHFLPEVYAGSRWPTIMADAIYTLVQRKSNQCTGNFFIDEVLLRESGVTDFSKYAVDPISPLMEDLYVDDPQLTNTFVPLSQDFFVQYANKNT